MSQSRIGYIDQNARSNWMRLHTLVTVRWVAITGQILALAVGQELYGLSLPLGPCAAVIGLSIIANIFAILIFPDNRRYSASHPFNASFSLLCSGHDHHRRFGSTAPALHEWAGT